jgi:acyl-coenzyme A synthetase/AMP-(fatty) acid ligase/acyl carrier protein
VESVGRHSPHSPESVVLWSSSPAFDSTIVETIVAFFNHARIVIPDADDLQSARAFWSLCERERVTILPISTALWHLVARPICVGERCAPASLRVVSFGGERANINLVSAWLRRAPQVRLLNGFGPTEAVVEALSAALNDVPEILRTVSVPIGRPMPGRVAYVLSPTSVPPSLCAFGEIGELYLGGTLADGYLGDQVHTTNRFVENRFGSGVLYRTGDLASLWPDGLFYFHGRRDREAKVRGYRINLDYLEEMLACASGVAQAAVVTHEGRLEAYVVLAEKAVTEHDVIAWVERTIPRSMQPTSVTVRDTLPLTPAGKLDRMALIAEEQDLTQTAPSDSEAVREAWTAVLESGVSAHSTVAGHGGDSLSLARIAAYLERHYGIDLPMDVMYSKPTLREQQEWVTQRRR